MWTAVALLALALVVLAAIGLAFVYEFQDRLERLECCLRDLILAREAAERERAEEIR
jgi:hypothetical protein